MTPTSGDRRKAQGVRSAALGAWVAAALAVVSCGGAPAEEGKPDDRREWVTACLAALRSPDPAVQRSAREALVAFGTDAIPLIVEESQRLRNAPVGNLGSVLRRLGVVAGRPAEPGDPSVPEALRERLRREWDLRAEVRKVLEQFQTGGVSLNDPRVQDLVRFGREAVPVLVAEIRDRPREQWAARHAAAEALGRLAGPGDVPALAQEMGRPDFMIATALQRVEGPEALGALLRPLAAGRADHDLVVALRERATAVPAEADAIGRGLTGWIRKAGTEHLSIAADAARALGTIRHVPARDAVRDVLAAGAAATPQEMREHEDIYLVALVRLGERAALDRLVSRFLARTARGGHHSEVAAALAEVMGEDWIEIEHDQSAAGWPAERDGVARWFKRHEDALRYDDEDRVWKAGAGR